jgi:hypothetical protein
VGHEQQDLRLVGKWVELYNKPGSRFVFECLIEDVVVDPGSAPH